MDLASSTVMVPSLPTLSIASAMISPMVVSQLAETVATCLISSLSLTFLEILARCSTAASTALLMPRWMPMGLAPAVTNFRPSRINRLGQNGGGGGAVAGGVAGLAGDFADHLGAHVFIGVFQFDFLGDGDAVLGDGGGAEFLVEHDVAAFGAERGVDGAGEFVDALQERLPRGFVEEELFCCHKLVISLLSRLNS